MGFTQLFKLINRWAMLSLLLTLLTVVQANAATVKLAVATNFIDAMQQIAVAFEKDTGHQTQISFASSGKLFAQIQHGAPYDVFLSADTQKPQRLVSKHLAEENSLFTYAIGRLGLWAPRQTINQTTAQSILNAGNFSHLAIANTKLAPYGIAAMETLKTMGVYQQLAPKLVQGENIGQAYQYIYSGNAELGLVAHSQLIKTNQHDYWLIPETMHNPILQAAALLTSGKSNPAASAFMRYLQSDKARAIIESSGYTTPNP